MFRHGNEGLEYSAQISKVRDSAGNLFSPNKAVLHDRDRKMLLLNPENKHKVFELDLETQTVVQEYSVDKVIVTSSLSFAQ